MWLALQYEVMIIKCLSLWCLTTDLYSHHSPLCLYQLHFHRHFFFKLLFVPKLAQIFTLGTKIELKSSKMCAIAMEVLGNVGWKKTTKIDRFCVYNVYGNTIYKHTKKYINSNVWFYRFCLFFIIKYHDCWMKHFTGLCSIYVDFFSFLHRLVSNFAPLNMF